MSVAEPDEVCLAYERLAARIDEDVRTKLVGLIDDGVDVFVAQVELVAVLGCPAPRAVKVAGARWVKQDGPGHVALVLLT